MSTLTQASSFLCYQRARTITRASIQMPKKLTTDPLNLPKLPSQVVLSVDQEINQNPKANTKETDPTAVEKLYLIMEAVADRVEMHKNIGEQRNNWNSLLLTSINAITLSAAIMAAIAATSVAYGASVEVPKFSSSFMYVAVTGMLIVMNKIQPSQLAEEQRNAARLLKQLHGHIQTKIAISNPTQDDVDEAMEEVLAIDRAYPLPLLGVMLEKFPSKCLRAPHAQDFLLAIPIDGLGQHMSPVEYRTILKYRLMIPLFPVDEVCPVCHKACLDSFGEHAVHCKELPGFKYRHDLVRDVLFDIFRCAGISAKKEAPVNFLTDPLEGRSTFRPADILVFGWVGGKHACVDLTGVSPLVGLGSSAFTVGQAALKAASGKVIKHEKACLDNQHVFIPFAFDTFGFLAPEAVDLLNRVQRVMHSNVMTPRSMDVVFKRLSFAIQKGVAAQLVQAAVWWPEKRSNTVKGKDSKTGWNEGLEDEMKEIARVLENKDKADYLRLDEKFLMLNKVLALSGPLLTGFGAIGSAFLGSSHHSWAAVAGVMCGVVASVVNSIEHGGQVGMVVEMYRSNAGFFGMVEESIGLNLKEGDVEKREDGELFEMKLALQLGRSVQELRDLAASSTKNEKEMKEFGSKLF
ncbi:putative petal formation-expressed [Helianthus anomalus]